jgi:hypothetical protein
VCCPSGRENVKVTCRGDDFLSGRRTRQLALGPPSVPSSTSAFKSLLPICRCRRNGWSTRDTRVALGAGPTHPPCWQLFQPSTFPHLYVSMSRDDTRLCILSRWTPCQGAQSRLTHDKGGKHALDMGSDTSLLPFDGKASGNQAPKFVSMT